MVLINLYCAVIDAELVNEFVSQIAYKPRVTAFWHYEMSG